MTFGTFFGQIGDAGTTNAVVLNVETLNLLDAANNVGFNASAIHQGGRRRLAGHHPRSREHGEGVVRRRDGRNRLQHEPDPDYNAATDLGVGKIAATGGNVGLDIAVGGTSNTTMTISSSTRCSKASAFTSFIPPFFFFGIQTSNGLSFGNTTITFTNGDGRCGARRRCRGLDLQVGPR
ncbi:MAG: hypothetical protein U1E60_14920 [Reyranellaceae bacterium]